MNELSQITTLAVMQTMIIVMLLADIGQSDAR